MLQNRLICPQCNCPLSPSSGQSTGMHCPRCNTWLDIDAQCKGSCMACHKTLQNDSSSCVEPVANVSDCCSENNQPNVVQREQWAGMASGGALAQAWKAVWSKLFPVR